ncbi:argonaute-like protein, partial [Aphelenchoides avenae]
PPRTSCAPCATDASSTRPATCRCSSSSWAPSATSSASSRSVTARSATCCRARWWTEVCRRMVALESTALTARNSTWSLMRLFA